MFPRANTVRSRRDEDNGRFYRFRSDAYGLLTEGQLEAAAVDADGGVRWVRVSASKPYRGKDTTAFNRGEGAWFDSDRRTVFFTTTADHRVWAFNAETDQLRLVYDAANGGPLREPDNVTVHSRSSRVFVAEDADDLQLVLLAEQSGEWVASPFLQLHGHGDSEIAGPAFNPAGTRLYFSSQRGIDGKNGMTFEVVGPF